MEAIDLQDALSKRLGRLRFADPVDRVYNPLVYARASSALYLERYFKPGVEALWLGMNPGPWGMAQTGVPFGEIAAARDWLKLQAPVGKPKNEHPKRPVEGFDCPRSEVSGRRVWGWAQERYGTPKKFFQQFFVWNYCPLVFMEASGKNRTPDKLPAEERAKLFKLCDQSLRDMVELLQPARIIGVGRFATDQAKKALVGMDLPIDTVLHPSPASPMANRGWAEQAEKQLKSMGIQLPAS
ncbi:MAG: single-stranded DNA-binding protein [Planctomycetota bacterium]|nr:single-stranded DNA-binding protein [Planctomycetota bacterium]